MVSRSESICREAEVYYYNIVSESGNVPDSVRQHVETCPHCRKEIDRLRNRLCENEPGSASPDGILLYMLKLHMSYADRNISCAIVKPFLPTLVDEHLRVTASTPITEHIEQCPACRSDLATLRRFQLSSDQLYKLYDMFFIWDQDEGETCQESDKIAGEIVSLNFHHIQIENRQDILHSLAVQRDILTRRRAYIDDKKNSAFAPGAHCGMLSYSDLFDYAFTFETEHGIEPGRYDGFRKFIKDHIRECPSCLDKLQELHETVFAIFTRPDSEVVTRYAGSEQIPAPSAQAPIRTESTVASPAGRRSLWSDRQTRRRIISIAASFLILLGLLSAIVPTIIGPAVAVDYEAVVEGTSRMDNLMLSFYEPDADRPHQRIYVSRPLGLRITISDEQTIVHDTNQKTVTILDNTGGEPIRRTEPLNHPDYISAFLQTLMPAARNLPVGSWTKIETLEPGTNQRPVNVYELTVSLGSGAAPVIRKSRYYIQEGDVYPQKVESFEQIRGTQDTDTAKLDRIVTYKPVTTREIQSVRESL